MTGITIFVLKASLTLSVFALSLKATLGDPTFLFRRPNHPRFQIAWLGRRYELSHPATETNNAVKA